MQTGGLKETLVIDRRHRLALRHHSAEHRRHALRRLRAAPGLHHLYAAQPVPRRAGSGSAVPAHPRRPGQDLRPRQQQRPGAAQPGAAQPDRALRDHQHAAGDHPPGSVPGGHRLLQPGPRSLARRRGPGHSRRRTADRISRQHPGQLPGHGPGLPELAGQRAAPHPGRPDYRLHRAGRALRELHPPHHDSFDPAFGRRGRHPRAPRDAQRFQRHLADRRHPADRHRQEERHHDDRLRAGSRARAGQAARRIHLPGLPAALPSHHDDHHGGPAGRAFRWRSAREPARSSGARWASPSSAACWSARC